jgi:peptide chain release factor 2
LNEVNAALENPSVWNEPKRAQELGREKKSLEDVVGTIDHLKSNLADNTELYEMSKADEAFDDLAAIEADAAGCARSSSSSSSAACSATRPTR